MAIEPIFDVIRTDERKLLGKSQNVVEAVGIPPASIALSKVLSVDAKCYVRATEAFAGEARYAGKVDFTVVFLDGNGKIQSLDYRSDFTGKVTGEAISASVKPQFSCEVLDIELISATGGAIKTACSVEVSLYGNCTKEIKRLVSCGEDAFVKDGHIEYECLACSGESTVVVVGKELATSGASVVKAGAICVIKKTDALDGAISVSGELVFSAILENEDGKPVCERLITPFIEELPAVEKINGSQIIACATVKSVSSRLTEVDGAKTLVFEAEVEIKYSVYTNGVAGYVVDAYSVDKEIVKKEQTINVACKVGTVRASEVVSGCVIASEDLVEVVCADAVYSVVTSVKSEDGCAVTEGAIKGVALCRNGEGAILSCDILVPFSASVPLPSGASVENVISTVVDASCKIRRGELEVRAELALELTHFEKKKARVITALEEGERVDSKPSALSVLVGSKNQVLFDVAKTLKAMPEQVLSQNPDLEFPLSGGERVLLYRNLTLRS